MPEAALGLAMELPGAPGMLSSNTSASDNAILLQQARAGDARALAEKYSWRACAEDFRRNLEPLPKERGRRFWHKLADLRKRAKERRRIAREKKAAERARAAT